MKCGMLFSLLLMTSFVSAMNDVPSEQEVMNLIQQVKEGKTDPSSLNKWPTGGRWGLLRILVRWDLKRTEKLLQAGADPNFYDGSDTPLACADFEGTKLLLKYSADPKQCEMSLLCHAMTVCYNEAEGRPIDKGLINETIDWMNRLIESGEDVDKWESGDFGRHLLYNIVKSRIEPNAKKALISCAIRNGSNPHLDYFKSDCGKLDGSVYAYLSSCEKYRCWTAFMRKEG